MAVKIGRAVAPPDRDAFAKLYFDPPEPPANHEIAAVGDDYMGPADCGVSEAMPH